MNFKKLLSILAVSILVLGTACTKPGGPTPSGPDDPDWDPTAGAVDVINGTKIEEGNNLCGWIYDPSTKKGIAGVPVTDGYTFTLTDANGVYQMKANAKCRVVYYTTPADCQIALDDKGVPDFYSKKTLKNLSKVQRYDFHLVPGAVVDKFTAIMVGDPQCCNYNESQRYKTETIKDIQTVINRGVNSGKYASPVAVTLGDVTFDSNDTYPYMRASMQNVMLDGGAKLPFMQCMGNHDHNALAFETTDTVEDMQYKARSMYITYFGPHDYSFNKGKAHFIVMDNVWVYSRSSSSKSNGATCSYYSGLTDEQYAWLKADLANVKDKENTLVIFCAHVPFRGGGSSSGSNVNKDKKYAEILTELSQFYEAHIMIGHTHYSQNYIHTSYKAKNNKPIYEHVHGSACGSWWSSHSDVIGGPNSYTIYSIEGNKIVDWVYKGTGRDENFQMRVYNGNQTYTGTKGYKFNWYNTEKLSLTDNISFPGNTLLKNAFVAQVWDDDDTYWKLEFWQDGAKVGDFTRLPNSSIVNKAVSGYWFNELTKKTDTWASKTASHYWYFLHPNRSKTNWDPELETGWEVKAEHTLPNGKTHTFTCNQLTVDYETFKQALSY